MVKKGNAHLGVPFFWMLISIMDEHNDDILDHEESEKVQNTFIASYRYTPFNFFGILLLLLGLFISIGDIIKPSKMSPMGVYIGIAVGLFGLFLMVVSYLCYRFLHKQKPTIYVIQFIIVILIIYQILKLFGMGFSNVFQLS